jgi:hypothetical protein
MMRALKTDLALHAQTKVSIQSECWKFSFEFDRKIVSLLGLVAAADRLRATGSCA